MAGRKSAKKKAAKKKAARKPAKKATKKKPKKKRKIRRVVGRPRPGVMPPPPPPPPPSTIVVIVITPTGFQKLVKAKRGNLVVIENQTPELRVVTFDRGWPFDAPSREIYAPPMNRSGLYRIETGASIKTYTASQVTYDTYAGQGGPPGDPILDVDG